MGACDANDKPGTTAALTERRICRGRQRLAAAARRPRYKIPKGCQCRVVLHLRRPALPETDRHLQGCSQASEREERAGVPADPQLMSRGAERSNKSVAKIVA